MAGNYFNHTRATVGSQKPGVRNRMYLGILSEFTTVAELDPADVAAGGAPAVTISDDHTFPVGKGFISLYFQPHTGAADGESVGEEGALHKMYKLKGFIPGDTAKLQAMMDALLNEDLIVLMESPDCTAGVVYQFGCSGVPTNFAVQKPVSGTTKEGKKGYEVEFTATTRHFYEGVITKMA